MEVKKEIEKAINGGVHMGTSMPAVGKYMDILHVIIKRTGKLL